MNKVCSGIDKHNHHVRKGKDDMKSFKKDLRSGKIKMGDAQASLAKKIMEKNNKFKFAKK
jgi:hypothetical protein